MYLGLMSQAMVEEGIVDPLAFNHFHASDFRIDKYSLTIRFPWGGCIHFEPLEIAIYTFFLMHPEGIECKQLQEYNKELLEQYQRFARCSGMDRAEQTIDHFCESMRNKNLIPLLSHIRGKIAKEMGPWASCRFGINRVNDGRYKIAALMQ